MAITIGGPPLADFREPIQMLRDCHRRIEHFLSVIGMLVQRSDEGGFNEEHRRALKTALQYFREAAPRHQQDEEKSLFPRIRASTDLRASRVMNELHRLEADHEAADRMHREVNGLVVRWLDTGTLDRIASQRLQALVTDLQELYREHISLEEAEIFPLAAQVLPSNEIHCVGSEMAQRRGLSGATRVSEQGAKPGATDEQR